MKKESLIKARDSIIKLLSMYGMDEVIDIIEDIDKIDNADRTELLINLYHFLDPKRYEENIRILKENTNVWKGLYDEEKVQVKK